MIRGRGGGGVRGWCLQKEIGQRENDAWEKSVDFKIKKKKEKERKNGIEGDRNQLEIFHCSGDVYREM